MTQRVFDIENEQDVKDLFNLFPDFIYRIRKVKTLTYLHDDETADYAWCMHEDEIKINWHNEIEIRRQGYDRKTVLKKQLWNLKDDIKTKDDLLEYFLAGVEAVGSTEPDFQWMLILCKDVLKIAKKKGWKK